MACYLERGFPFLSVFFILAVSCVCIESGAQCTFSSEENKRGCAER